MLGRPHLVYDPVRSAMLFASTDLAARIERAERRLVADSVAATARRHPEIDVFVAELAGGVAAWSGEGSPFNKVVGLGFAGAPDEGQLAVVERELARRGAPAQVELSCLAEPSIAARLTERGYVLQGFENVLGRPLSREPEAGPGRGGGIDIAVSAAEELRAWLDVVATGFASPDAQGVASHESFPRAVLERVTADMASTEGFVRYLARRDGAPAGGASMRLCDGVAQLCGAGTLPEHRRRGVQTALLEERLGVAGRAGCDIAVVTTQPGSRSQENSRRRGFELLYTRAVLVREP